MKIRTRLIIVPILSLIIFGVGGFFVFETLQDVIVVNQIHDVETDELMAISKLPGDLDTIRGSIGEVMLGIATKDTFDENWRVYDEDSAALKEILARPNISVDVDEDEDDGLISEEHSLEIFQKINDSVSLLREKSYELVGNYSEEEADKVKREYREIDELFYDFSEKFRDMSNDNLSELTALKVTVDSTQNYARNLILAIFAGATLLGLVLAQLNARKITMELRTIRDAAAEILKGNLNKRIEVISKNEAGELAQEFNEMVSDLQNSNNSLESKVQERTKELEDAKASVEKEVQKRTEELNRTVDILKRTTAAMTDREMKMIELKKEIDDLHKKLGDKAI